MAKKKSAAQLDHESSGVRTCTPVPIRYVKIRGARYLRLEDVAAFVRELGGGEETDVRNRLNQGAEHLLQHMHKP